MLMTADPILPDWVFPPAEGFVAEDLDRIPDLPPHTQLIDGSLVFVSPRAPFHFVAVDTVNGALNDQVPPEFLVARETMITIGRAQRVEPDVMVIHAEAFVDLDHADFVAADVVLAIEVVSPSSRDHDRIRKPQLYAEAGIRHFWRVENEQRHAAVFVYELDQAARKYALTGVHRGKLDLTVPFPIAIDLTQVNRYGPRR